MAKPGPRARAASDTAALSGSKDFGKEVRAALTKRGIRFVGVTWLPDEKGSFANGHRGYLLDDNGTGSYETILVCSG